MEEVTRYYKKNKLEKSWLGLASGLDVLVALLYELEQLSTYNRSMFKLLIIEKKNLESFFQTLQTYLDADFIKLFAKGPNKFVAPYNLGKTSIGSTKIGPLGEVFLNRLKWVCVKLYGQCDDTHKWNIENLMYYSNDLPRLKQFALDIAKYYMFFRDIDHQIDKAIEQTKQVKIYNINLEQIKPEKKPQPETKLPKIIHSRTINWHTQPLYIRSQYSNDVTEETLSDIDDSIDMQVYEHEQEENGKWTVITNKRRK